MKPKTNVTKSQTHTQNYIHYIMYSPTIMQQTDFDNSSRIQDTIPPPLPLSSLQINVYRYKFSNDFMEKMYEFSKIHQYDDRKAFKEAWTTWIEDNNPDIDEEVRRLDALGYDGNIMDKMFKSARYYFRKKGTVKKEPKQRRIYVSCAKETLDAMDAHIIKSLTGENPCKPSDGFQDFCNQYHDVLKTEVHHLLAEKINDAEEIREKIKKTYKKRYFIITNNESRC